MTETMSRLPQLLHNNHPKKSFNQNGMKNAIDSVLTIQIDLKKIHYAAGAPNPKVCATIGAVGNGQQLGTAILLMVPPKSKSMVRQLKIIFKINQ